MEVILGLRPPRSDAPFAALDELYTHIFSTVDDRDLVLQVLSLTILGTSKLCEVLEGILGLEDGDIKVLLSTLGSIVVVNWVSWDIGLGFEVHILHKSLEDYLLEESRSKELCICRAEKHTEYAHLLFQRIWDDYPSMQSFVSAYDEH